MKKCSHSTHHALAELNITPLLDLAFGLGEYLAQPGDLVVQGCGGGLAILDLASANGTAVNGTEVAAGDRHELATGDVITMGRWTRITVDRRAP